MIYEKLVTLGGDAYTPRGMYRRGRLYAQDLRPPYHPVITLDSNSKNRYIDIVILHYFYYEYENCY